MALFIGLVACMYSVKINKDIYVVVKLVDTVLPSDMMELDDFMADGALIPVLLMFQVLQTKKGSRVLQSD